VESRLHFAQMRQSRQNTNRSVSTHAEVAYIVEKYDGSRRRGINWFEQKRSDYDLGAARLTHNRRPKMIKLRAESLQTFGDRAVAKIGTTGHNHPGRLTLGVRVYDMDRRLKRHDQ